MTRQRISMQQFFFALALGLVFSATAQQMPVESEPTSALDANVGSVLVRGPAGEVTMAEFQAAVAVRVPQVQRESFYANPRNIEQLALSVYTRKALVAQARQQGFNPQPEARQQSSAETDAEQVLIDQWITQQLSRRLPDERQLEQYARSVFDAQPGEKHDSAQLRLRHIMLAVNSALPDEQAHAKAASLLDELKNGADFQALARRDSTDKGSAARGGEMAMPLLAEPGRSTFDDAALALQRPGQISGVVRSADGYHIIQLIERKTVSAFERVRESLMTQARARLEAEARQQIWSDARAGASVDAGVVQSLVRPREAK